MEPTRKYTLVDTGLNSLEIKGNVYFGTNVRNLDKDRETEKRTEICFLEE
jgi:hypothetical protein